MMQANPIVPEGDRGCGARLRKAREMAGLTEADVGARLKMPLRVVQSLEAEDWSRLGAPVFVRGQLRSYSRLLGLTTAPMVAASGVAPIEPPVLVPRTYTPPMQRLVEQVARRFVYIVLTAAIAVPVWLATRPHLGVVSHDAAPLDVPANGGAVDMGSASTLDDAIAKSEPSPVVASLTPLPPRPAAAPALSLRLTGDSWVQVIAADGRTLEQSLFRAGEQRSYSAGEVARIVLGNATVVKVQHNGQIQDLTPYLRSNVARFTVSSDGSLAPAAD
ncbi:MAG: helix-turn-helix domain-containing protein [Luteimonas sp.]